MSSQRVDAYLSGHGLCARRKVQQFLDEHEVFVDGKRILLSGERIDTEAKVLVDGRLLQAIRYHYIALNKPIRYLCSNVDSEGRALAIDLIDGDMRRGLHHVGRLDYFSEGLLLFTNDGDFTKKLTHPSHEVEKEYRITLERSLSGAEEAKLRRPLRIDGVEYRFSGVAYEGKHRYRIILKEGKNREIRRVFAFFSVKILKLQRIRIGSISLDSLALGQWRYLNSFEIEGFKD
ncbi:pseudouridine synthase [Entomospira culicis]|uniref:Pseudouridine synthase n=1 Tax=Entomospira culicis TaxID=2719989 RepID=A0A968GID3_9SPIO|nr:pseudouridine synthase [Entomospira culicis]NIZ19571.1 rRNA pseudouridine synthase [Entomospira culicis]NIZ69524.1 rRNA pseudouridine synthase [Entomospira culicis]WDI36637.1 pseudouridine synthase [Entomospira culicis]WDI38266.1 pseudouridine synthase [Entomospira culicis]